MKNYESPAARIPGLAHAVTNRVRVDDMGESNQRRVRPRLSEPPPAATGDTVSARSGRPVADLVQQAIHGLQSTDLRMAAGANIIAIVCDMLRRGNVEIAAEQRTLLMQHLHHVLQSRSIEALPPTSQYEVLAPLIEHAIAEHRAFDDERSAQIFRTLSPAISGDASEVQAHTLELLLEAHKNHILRIPSEARTQIARNLIAALRAPSTRPEQAVKFMTAVLRSVNDRCVDLRASDLDAVAKHAIEILGMPAVPINHRAGICAHVGIATQKNAMPLTREQATRLCRNAFFFLSNEQAGVYEKLVIGTALTSSILTKQIQLPPKQVEQIVKNGLQLMPSPLLTSKQRTSLTVRLLTLTRYLTERISLEARQDVISAAAAHLASDETDESHKLMLASHLAAPVQSPSNDVPYAERRRFVQHALTRIYPSTAITAERVTIARMLTLGVGSGRLPLTRPESHALAVTGLRYLHGDNDVDVAHLQLLGSAVVMAAGANRLPISVPQAVHVIQRYGLAKATASAAMV